MSQYFSRILDAQIQESLNTFGAVIIEGPRAVGKTTTALQNAKSSIRIDSSPQLIELAQVAPDSLLDGDVPRLIDEWQLAPTLWNAVRNVVDTRGEPGQFILTGSAMPADDVTRHSGAGRFKRLFLRPMTLSESGESTSSVSFKSFFENTKVAGVGGLTVPDYARMIVRGGWPALVKNSSRNPTDYLSSYLDDISRVDMPASDIRVDPLRMAALVRALARNISTEIAATKLAEEAELGTRDQVISAQTVRRYLDALTRIHVLEEQPAWRTHLRSNVRLRVSPKWHFVDPSLAAASLQVDANGLLNDLNFLGLFFESLVVRDFRVYAESLDASIYHYRDSENLEVDLIAEKRDGTWAAFEVKLGSEESVESAARSLKKLAEKVSEKRFADLRSLNVVTAGNVSYTRPDGINVVALGHLH